jgi:hypothetical protein
VTAARHALDAGDVDLVLPFVHADGESEVRAMFRQVLPVRSLGPEARATADRLFFETVVRVHRSGEGAPYTGLKPAGLPVGPVIPLAERAIEEECIHQLADFLNNALREELQHRLDLVHGLAQHRGRSLQTEREYVQAVLSFEVYSHHLYQAIHSKTHHEAASPK